MSNNKFLSHRLLGFGSGESSLSALRHAMNSNIPYLEVDTRVSKDGTIYINHNPTLESSYSSLTIANSNAKKIDAFITKHALNTPKLDAFLALYAQRKNTKQMLMLDIKDYGFEQLHLSFVKKHRLTENITWVSWIPQTLLLLDKLAPNMPKVLSYMPVNNFFYTFTQNITIKKVPFSPIILLGENYYNKELGIYSHGFQHAYFSPKLNNELISMLSKNGGGVCISKKVITHDLINFNRLNNIKTAIFSVADRREYKEFSSFGADIIFCDFIDQEVVSL